MGGVHIPIIILLHILSLYFNWKKVFVFSLLLLLFFQYQTTTLQSLTLLDNDEQRIQQIRLKEYKPSSHYLRVLFHRFDLINFFEGSIGVASTRLQRNFFESIDPNVYFFGGHPRERVWANDFEKLPYLAIFPFLIGLYHVIDRKKYLIWISFSAGVILLTVIGHKNHLGPFILFPTILLTTFMGAIIIANFFKKR